MIDDRKALHLTGETIREIGTLILVFAPLDAFLQTDEPSQPLLGVVMSVALFLIMSGIMLEVED
jgi:hypothetical protein